MSKAEEEKDSERQRVVENERRFLVLYLPDDLREQLLSLPFEDITQGYLFGEERIRQTTTPSGETTYVLSNKTATMYHTLGVSTKYDEGRPMSDDEFKELWPQTKGARIAKRRYRIPAEHGLTYELDVFKGGDINGHMLVEVEFPTAAMAQRFTPPDWFGNDVTEVVSSKKLVKGKPLAHELLRNSAVFNINEAT